ncbi:response regulator [Cochleicola gelatinilyticus]|uniref:histidine kinase n=1 Tax=Cochleicola gelatinilyticus TaxID=1763537 RepID=A0A167IHV9_9FLAO|nr:response regulator [Cochleicola gelatinilyticus]OAB79668.1 hypothetical protein ULVI_02660 [Cochleicola gelatinilyticus]
MKKIPLLFIFLASFSFGQSQEKREDALLSLNASEKLYAEKKYDEAYQKAKSAFDYFSQSENDSLLHIARNQLILVSAKTNSEEKEIVYQQAVDAALQKKNWTQLAEVYYTKGRTYFLEREMGTAQPYYIKVDSLARIYNFQNEIMVNAILDRSEIARTTFTYEGVEQASALQETALKLAQQLESEELINNIYLRLADMRGLQGDVSEAKRYTDLAFKYYSTKDNPKRLTKVYLTYMNYYYAIDDYDAAGKKLEEGIAYLKNKNNPYELASVLTAYGTYFRKRRKNCTKAIEQFEKAKAIYDTLAEKESDRYMYLMEGLALCNAEIGDYKAGYAYYQKTYETKKALVKKENNSLTRSLETRYESEKKKQEIALLKSKNELSEQRRKNQKTILLSGLILVALGGLFLFFQLRNRKKVSNKLKELDAAKSNFFANISHEFRTPLALIKGPIEDQLELSNLTTSQRKNLRSAQRNTARLEALVEQLLALSKLENGTIPLQVQPGNLPRFITAQTEAFSYQCLEKKIDYSVKIENDENTDWFDRDMLEKITFNLIGNAVKYTPENGSVEVLGKRIGHQFELSIINSGAYISIEEQQSIFKRFYQSNPKNSGTGIGLALTKELVELHKGQITLDSEENGYTQFTILLPTSKEDFIDTELLSEVLQTKDSITLETEIISSEIQKKTTEVTEALLLHPDDAPVLLIVDDSKDIRDYVTSVFETTYKVLQAANGNEAFEQAVIEIPDLVISDVMMPEEDGFSLTKKLKEHELTAHIPIILLTAKTKVTDKLEGMGVGADAYLTKPFSSQLVKATVANLIENRRKLQQRFSQEVILRPKEIALSSADEQFLERLQVVMDDHITNSEFTVERFGKEMGVSRMQLHRKLKALTGQSTSEFLRSQRLKLAIVLLKKNTVTISEVAYSVGFNDPSYFTKCFKEEFGCSPTQYVSR